MDREKIARELVEVAGLLTAREKRIDVFRRIVENGQYEKIDRHIVDVTTASMLIKIFEALKPSLQRKFDKIPLPKLVDFGWSMVK